MVFSPGGSVRRKMPHLISLTQKGKVNCQQSCGGNDIEWVYTYEGVLLGAQTIAILSGSMT